MSCPGTPCTPAPSLGSWTFTANPSANTFCDTRLIGLAQSDASMGTTLIAVDPITGCLSRPAAPKGIYQHDPDGCLPDFIGPLDDPAFSNIANLDSTKAHALPLLESECGDTTHHLVKQPVVPGNVGLPAMLRDECCTGGTHWAIMAPELLINGRQSTAGPCVSPRVLAYVPYERTVCEGRTVTEYRWYAMDKWQQAEAADVVAGDIFEIEDGQTQNVWFTVWRTETCAGGGAVKQLVKANPAQVKRMLGIGAGGNFVFLDTPTVIYSQHKSVNPGGAVFDYFLPGLPVSGPLPLTSGSVNINLETTFPTQWDEDVKGVILSLYLKGTTITQFFDMCIVVNGREYSRISLPGSDAGDNSPNQIIVPVPANKIIVVTIHYQITTAGSVGSGLALVYVDGFVK